MCRWTSIGGASAPGRPSPFPSTAIRSASDKRLRTERPLLMSAPDSCRRLAWPLKSTMPLASRIRSAVSRSWRDWVWLTSPPLSRYDDGGGDRGDDDGGGRGCAHGHDGHGSGRDDDGCAGAAVGCLRCSPGTAVI